MTDAVETRIKLVAMPAMLERLRTNPMLSGRDEVAFHFATYFDTIGGKLRRSGAALRIRESGGSLEKALRVLPKSGSAARRGEWNVPAPHGLPDPSGFPPKAQKALLRLLDGATLEPVATTHIERTTRRLDFNASTIGVSFVVGMIEAGAREEPVCELEMELIEGCLDDVLKLAQDLPLGPELSWSVRRKAERCHALAFDLLPAAVYAQPVKLTPGMDVAGGFQAIAWNCLDQLLANYPLVIASGDPEAVHQCRVAIRRLRAACSLFDDIADDEESHILRAEFREVARSLGPVRDLHVLQSRVAAAAEAGNENSAELLDYIAGRRDAATKSARAMMAAETFQRLLFRFAGWVESGEWLARTEDTGGSQSLVSFATRILARRRRKLRRVCSLLTDMENMELHQLRIDGKKLRYASGFFSTLCRSKDARKLQQDFAKALAQLQNSLGEVNDMAVVAAGRSALFADLDAITTARLDNQLEGVLATDGARRRRLLKVAERSLLRVQQIPAWWKGK